MQGIFNYFSNNISQILKYYFRGQPDNKINTLEEIRVRSNGSICLKFSDDSQILSNKVLYEDIIQTLQIMCDNSIYSYQNEICNGYITVKGGHRVGITGNCVIQDEKLININYISGLNFRISRQIIGCSSKVLEHILRLKENTVYNTLIVSPPGARENHPTKRFDKKYKYRN